MIPNVWGKLKNLSDQGVLDALVWLGGNLVYVDGSAGDDARDGSIGAPLKTLEAAYALLRSGMNDAIVVTGNPLTDAAGSCTVRLDAAFVWSKPATHLVGLNTSFAPSLFAPRARIAPTPATTAFANFFTITATGCLFRGVEWNHDFTADTTSQIAVTVKGARNVFQRCHILGNFNDDAAGRSLVLSANASGNIGENYFDDCTIGQDTITRAQASAILGLIGTQVPRNYFRNCRFISWATAAGALMISIGASAIDRFVYFENCKFINFGTALTSLMAIGATQNGKVLMENCSRFNCGNFGDTTNTLITGPVTVNTSGLGTAPAA
jgi:hypothetical protein